MNRRKMGTSRRSKGRQLLKDPEKQPDIESIEDVQDEASGNKHSEKYESAAKQPKVQEEVNQETKCGKTAPQAAFLVPATTTEYSEDETGMFSLEEAEHTLVSRDVNIHSFKDETKLELARQSEKVNKNLHDGLPGATGLSASALDQQMISKKTEDINLYSVAESKSNKPEDMGLFRQDARLPCNFSVCESHVNTSITPQITADNAPRENIKSNDGVKQELSQKEELPTSKDGELFITPEVRHAQYSEQGEENVYDQNNTTQMQGDHQKDLLHDQEDVDSFSESQKSESDSSQFIFLVKSTAVKQEALTTKEKTSLGQMDQSGVLMEDNIKQIGESVCIEGVLSETEKNNLSVQTLVSDLKAPTEPQLQLISQTTDEHTEPDFIFGSTKRQLGSSRRNKGKQHVESKEDILGNTQTTETPTELPELKETGQEEVSEDTADDIILSLSHGSLVSLVSPHISSEDPETDSLSLILDSENFQKDQDETNPKILVEVVENSDVSLYDVDQSDTLHSKGTIDSLLENVLGKVQKVEVHSTQMQKSPQIKHSSETSSGVITKDFENIFENLTDQAKISEFAGKSNDNFTTKHKEHQTEENILKDTESIQPKKESYDLQKPNSAPSHVHEFKKGVENDIKLTKDQMFNQENKGLFLEMEKKEIVLFDPQPQEASGSVDEQFNKAFHITVNRRKLGFSRKSKGRQDTDSKEAKEKTSDEETTQKTDTKIMSQDELRLDMEHDVILPVSHDSSMLSIIPSGQSLEVQSSMPNIYPENDPQSLIPETDINMKLSDESWEVTSGCQSDTLRSKSGIHQTKHVKGPYPGDKVGQGDKHEALQTQAQEPQQMDYTVDSHVGEGGVFVEDTKNNPTNPQLQDHSLSSNEETNAGFSFSGSRKKLGSSRRRKGRQQGKESTEEALHNTRSDKTQETPSMIMQEEVNEDNEPRISISVSNTRSLFPNPPLDQSDLMGLVVKCENLHENQDESKSDTENIMDVSQQAVEKFEASYSKDTSNAVAEDLPRKDGGVEVYSTKMEKSLQAEHLSETVPCGITGNFQNISENLADQPDMSELNLKTNDDSAAKQENYAEAVDVKNKDSGLYGTNQPQISDLEKIDPAPIEVEEFKARVENNLQVTNPHTLDQTFHLGKKGFFSELEENKAVSSSFQSETVSLDSKPQEMPDSVDKETNTSFYSTGKRRKMGSSRSSKGRQQDKTSEDVKEKSREVLTLESSCISLETKTTIQEELQQDRECNRLPVSNNSLMFTPGRSSEIQSFIPCTYPETDLVSLVSKDVYFTKNQDESETGNNVDLFEKSGKDTLVNKSETLENQERISPDDTKPKADQIFHQEKEGIFHEMEENKHVLSKLQPETVPLNPQPQKTSECAYEQINTDFSNSASRRKLGSSRKSKATRQLKESEEEINEKTWVDKTPEITQISLDTKTVSQEEQRQDVEQDMTLKVSYDSSVFSVFTPGDLSEIQSSMQKNDPETDLDSLTQGIVNHPGDQDESKTSKVDLSYKSEEESSLDKSDLMESKDETLQNKEVISPEHTKNDVKKADEQEDPPTNIERSLQMDYTSETVTHDVPQYLETDLGDMIDQAEIISSIQSELVKCSDGSDTKQGLLPAEDQQNLCFRTEGNVEALDQISKDDHLYDSKKTWMADGVNTTSGQVDEGEGLIGDIKHSPANAQPREASGNMDKQSNKGKLGFSCKSEGRQQDKDFKNEVREKSSGEETTQTSLDTKIMSQDELRLDMEHDVILHVSHDSSMLSIIPSDQSLEVQSSLQKIYSENDPQSLIPETDINMKLSDESWEVTSGCQSDTLRSKSGIHQTKHVKGPYPGDKVGQGEEHEALQTQAQEPQQMDYTVDNYVGEGGVFVEDTKKPTNPQLQDHSLSSNEQTNVDFSFSVSRKKLGSSRRNKGKQLGKESTEEALHNTRGDKTHETPSMSSLPSMTVEQEELIEDTKQDIILSVSHDSSMALIPPVIYFDDQSSVPTNYPDKDMQSLIVKKCNLQEDLERNSDNLVQDGEKSADLSINKSDCFYRDTGNAVSENAVDDVHEDIHSTQIQDSLQTNSNETIRGDAAENVEIFSGTLTDQAEVSELKVKTIEEITTKEEAYPLKGIISDSLGLKNEETVQHDVKPNTDQELHQDKEGLFCEMEENEFAISSLQSEKKSFNFQPQESSESVDNPTEVYLHSSGNRKKFGSSRRNKSRSKTKDSADETYNQPIKRVDVNASINELCEKTTETAVQGQEKSMSNVLDEVEENESSHTEDVNTGTSDCTAVGIQPSPTVDQEVTDTSCCVPIKDRELTKPHSRDKYRELCMLDGNLQESILFPEPHAACPPTTEKSSCCERTEPESGDGDAFKKPLEQETKPTQSRGMLQTTEKDIYDTAGNHETYFRNQTEKKAMDEVTEMSQPDENVQSKHLCAPSETEENGNMYHAQAECSIEQGTVLSPDMFSTDAEENRHITLSRAAETHDLVYVVSKHQKEQVKTKQMQDTHQILLPNECPRQTLHLNKDATLDSQPLENYQGLKDDGHLGLKASGNKRKMGSSRRNKGRKHSQVTEQNPENKDDALESTGDDKTTQMLAARTAGQEELENLILPENLATFTSTVTEKVLEENTVFAHDVLKDSAIATSNFNPNSNQENSLISNAETKEKNAKPIKTEDSIQLTGYDTDKKGVMQSVQASVWKDGSNMQSILFHDSIISLKPESVHVNVQEEALQRQNRDALSCGKDLPGPEVHFQQTNKEIETIGFGTEDCSSGGESSMDVHNLKQEEVGEKCTFATQQKHCTNEFVSDSQEPAMHASYKGGNSTPINALDSQGEKPQVTSKQKKKKIGSSRRTPMNRKREGETHKKDETEESDFSTKADMMNLGEMEVVGEVPVNVELLQDEDVTPQQQTLIQQETPETETSDGLQSSNTSLVFLPEQSAKIDLIETPKPDDFSSTETQITSEVAERNSDVINQSIYSNTGTPGGSLELFCDLSQNIQGDDHSPENKEVRQVQDIQEQMPSIMTQGIQSQHPEIRKSSPDLTPTNRRRKMGSTRKNLGTRTKQEIMDPENESTDTVTSSGDVTVVSVSGKEDTELQLHTEHIYENSHQGKEKETVEISQFGESLLRALAEEMAEESSISEKQMVETEQQQSPSGLSSSPPSSESASGGRRKKFGSNRKSGLQQRKLDQNPQNKDEAGGTVEGGPHKEAERGNSSGLSKISEVYDNEDKASSSTNIAEAAEFLKPVRENTQEKLLHGAIRLDQESGSHFSFGTTSDTDKSDCYNVVMIGESCVGKTSFMKRAQSGKFSLELPASVGLDSCKWTVVVDGKPMVLHLWDTAGQERFHSITRQVFHKAQAFLLMYDITSSQSFSAVSYWANSIQEAAAQDVTVLLLGNKSDQAKRQVKTEQGDILAKEYNFNFMECSAATGENVIEALETVARMLSHRADLLREEVTVLHREPAQRKTSKCC